MTTIRAIVFDFGGVLINWDPRNLYRRYFSDPQEMERFLSEIDFYAWNAEQDKGRPFAQGVAILSAQFPQYAHLIHAYHEHWETSLNGAIPGTIEILKTLKRQGYALFGLSNWSAETYPQVRKKYTFFDLFDHIIISGRVDMVKPHPAIFNLLLNQTGYDAPECVFIDDSPANVHAASKLGFRALHFTSPEKLRSQLEQLGLLSHAPQEDK
ncbi:MAG: HAD-IA family hydrolase [Anaerolineales bacterium]